MDCSLLNPKDIVSSTACALLKQWLVGAATCDAFPHNIQFKLYEVVQHIFARTQTEELCDPSLLINVDEAHKLDQTMLGAVLRSLLNLLVVYKLRVFVVVTGVTSAAIKGALLSSDVGAHEISLPLLEFHHVQDIVQGFFPEIESVNHILRHILWWVGGVPRFLQYMITAAAEFSREVDKVGCGARKPVAECLKALKESTASGIVQSLAYKVYSRNSVSNEALDAAFSFALLEIEVPGSFELTKEETVECAQRNSQL